MENCALRQCGVDIVFDLQEGRTENLPLQEHEKHVMCAIT